MALLVNEPQPKSYSHSEETESELHPLRGIQGTQQSCVVAPDAALSPAALGVQFKLIKGQSYIFLQNRKEGLQTCCSCCCCCSRTHRRESRWSSSHTLAYKHTLTQSATRTAVCLAGKLPASSRTSSILRTVVESYGLDAGGHTDAHNVKETRSFLRVWKMIATSGELSIMVRRCLLTFKPFR